ncbi:Retrovirus-related Pol polyprotein from transposon 17.6, partial [Mucuna pruriens]
MSSVSFGQRGDFLCRVISQGVFPNSSEPFLVYSDVSKMSLSDVLMLKDLLKTHERNYPTHDVELAIMVFTLKIWRHYLYDIKFEVFSDHKSLRYLFDQKVLNTRLRRWLEYPKDFDFDHSYHSRKANVTSESLRLGILKVTSSLMDVYNTYTFKLLKIPSHKDPWFVPYDTYKLNK